MQKLWTLVLVGALAIAPGESFGGDLEAEGEVASPLFLTPLGIPESVDEDTDLVVETPPACQPSVPIDPRLAPYGSPIASYRETFLYRSPYPDVLLTATGEPFIPVENRLPAPADPGRVIGNPAEVAGRLGPSVPLSLPLSTLGIESATAAVGGRVGVRAVRDSGYIAGLGTFDPQEIALDGSDELRMRGQFGLSLFSGDVLAAIETKSVVPIRSQLLVEGDFIGDLADDRPDDIFLRNAYARFVTDDRTATGYSVEAGSLDSLFADYASVPKSLEDVVPVGSVGRRAINTTAGEIEEQLQIRLGYKFESGIQLAAGLKNPDTSDFENVSSPSILLKKAPDIILRARFQEKASWNSYQAGVLIRQFAANLLPDNNVQATGWGIMGSARARTDDKRNCLYVGGGGGNGIGENIFGVSVAATLDGDHIDTIGAAGGYVGFQRVWAFANNECPLLASNVAYGIAAIDPQQSLSDDTNRRVQQAWANTVWQLNDRTALAFEYHFGTRLILDGTEGTNHRVMVVLQVGTNTPASQFATRADAERYTRSLDDWRL